MDTNLLDKLIETVNDYLESIDVKVPFFVAGGSVYSTINGSNHYDDIDVFFYTREDCDAVTNKLKPIETTPFIVDDVTITTVTTNIDAYVTSNAVTVSSIPKSPLRRQIQFVKRHVGDVDDVFDTFDFNCSKVAFTSDGEFIKSFDYTKHITVNEKNINGMILDRYSKYKSKKGCADDDYVAFKQIIRYLIDNYNKQFDTGYTADPCIVGHAMLDNAIRNTSTFPASQYVHDYIQTKPEAFRIDIFSKLPALLNIEINNISDELYLFLLLRAIKNPSIYKCNDKPNVRVKYAEYFI